MIGKWMDIHSGVSEVEGRQAIPPKRSTKQNHFTHLGLLICFLILFGGIGTITDFFKNAI